MLHLDDVEHRQAVLAGVDQRCTVSPNIRVGGPGKGCFIKTLKPLQKSLWVLKKDLACQTVIPCIAFINYQASTSRSKMLVAAVVSITLLSFAGASPLDVVLTLVVGAGGSTTTSGNSVSMFSTGNSAMTGSTNGNLTSTGAPGANKPIIRSYSQDGAVLWTDQAAAATGNAEFVSSTTDQFNNVYAVGSCTGPWYGGTLSGDSDVCLAKYDPLGFKNLSTQVGSSGYDYPYSVAVDRSSGVMYVVGVTTSATWDDKAKIGTSDAFLLKISPNGAVQDLFRFGVADYATFFLSVAVDGNGDI